MKTIFRLSYILMLLFVSSSVSAQSWQYTGSLSMEKRTGILTTLPNQTAIYVGGADASGIALNTCELYDPATASWNIAAAMAIGRERHTATLLPDGQLVVIGGNTSPEYDYSIPTGSIEIYDYTKNQWSNGGSLLLPRQNHTSTLLQNGTILITGGYTGSGITSSVEIYDPSTGKCINAAPLMLARHDHSATLLNDGRVIIVGGRDGGSGSDYFNESEIYDPSTNTWQVIGNMAQARIKGSLVCFSDGSVIASGGRNTPNTSAPGSEVLTGSLMNWTSTSPMFQPVTWQTTDLMPNDRLLVTGGIVDDNWSNSFTGVMTPTCEWYDKQNQRWFYAPQLNQARSYHASCFIHQTVNDNLPEDLILVAAGITGDYTFTNTAEVLDVTDHALLAYKAMPANTNSAAVNNTSISYSASIVTPSPDQAILQLSISSASNVKVEVYSSTGESVSPIQQMSLAPGTYGIPLNISSSASGVYFVHVSTGSQNTFLKFALFR